jgi:hypothetical protein
MSDDRVKTIFNHSEPTQRYGLVPAYRTGRAVLEYSDGSQLYPVRIGPIAMSAYYVMRGIVYECEDGRFSLTEYGQQFMKDMLNVSEEVSRQWRFVDKGR